MSPSGDQEYFRLPNSQQHCLDTSFEEEALSLEETSDLSLLEKHESFDKRPKRISIIHVVSLLNILVLFASFLVFITGVLWQTDIDRKCLDLHSEYSPALKEIDPKHTRVKFNGTLDHPSVYRGDPSPDIDAAWDNIEDIRPMSITEEELLSIGKSTDAIKVPPQFGGGYIASVELNHQIHCLNFLRKSLFLDYYAPPSPYASVEFTDKPAMVANHQAHCVEMLRQFIMCHADVGIITHRWVKDYPRPYPDFNTWHQCRNFESALQWTKERQWKEEDGGLPRGWTFAPGEGEVILDVPP